MPTIEEQAVQATATLAQLTKDYQASPDGRAAAARDRLQRIHADPNQQAEARHLEAELQRAEKDASALAASLSEGARIDQALAGIVERGPETTVEGQISQPDLVTAVGGLVRHGVRDEAIKSFLETGQVANGEDRETQIHAAQEWLRRLMANEGGLQDKLFAGDPEVKRQFDAFAMYAPSNKERTETYDRVAAGMSAW